MEPQLSNPAPNPNTSEAPQQVPVSVSQQPQTSPPANLPYDPTAFHSRPEASPTQKVPQSKHSDSVPKWLIISTVIGLVIIVVLIVILVTHKSSKPVVTQKLMYGDQHASQSTTVPSPTALQNQQNTERLNDVTALIAGITSYSSNNRGTLPLTTNSSNTTVQSQTLELCGASCAGTTTNKLSDVNLGFYTDGDISIVPYSSTLAVKEANTVEIVDNSTCNNQTTIGNQTKPSALSFVVLYALQKGTTVDQQCKIGSV